MDSHQKTKAATNINSPLRNKEEEWAKSDAHVYWQSTLQMSLRYTILRCQKKTSGKSYMPLKLLAGW